MSLSAQQERIHNITLGVPAKNLTSAKLSSSTEIFPDAITET